MSKEMPQSRITTLPRNQYRDKKQMNTKQTLHSKPAALKQRTTSVGTSWIAFFIFYFETVLWQSYMNVYKNCW